MTRLSLVFTAMLVCSVANSATICHDLFIVSVEQREIQEYYEQMTTPLAEQGWKKHSLAEFVVEGDAILRDAREGAGKRDAYRKLGFDIAPGRFRGPAWKDFVRNFTRTMDQLGIPENERIYPSIVLIKRKSFDSTASDFHFITPGKDPWPTESGYRVYDLIRDPFNLPVAATMKALRRGRFPLLAHHDAGHFVGFVQNPAYMRAIRRTFASLGRISSGSSFYSRLAIVLETLSLGNPSARAEMQALFATPAIRNGARFVRIQEVMETMQSMPADRLIEHATKISGKYESLMADYGGANARAFERDGRTYLVKYGDEKNQLDAVTVMYRQMGRRQSDSIYTDIVIGTHGAEIKVLVEAYEQWPGSALAVNRVLAQRLGNEWQTGSIGNGKDVILEIIREETARAEFFLWNSSHIPVERWVSSMLSAEPMNLNSPAALVLRETLGADSPIYKRIAGDTAPR